MKWHFHPYIVPSIHLTSVITLDIIVCVFKQGKPKISRSNLMAGKLEEKMSSTRTIMTSL